MRTSNAIHIALVVLGVGLVPASAFDRQTATSVALPPLTAPEAFRSGTEALQAGDASKAVSSLQYAAEQGHAVAQWKLGRMYARGDGVPQDDVKAFRYFSGIANMHADDSPFTPEARFVASAFVALGHYYLEGIPNSPVQSDADRAREMYRYAASYFGDPDAQYHLGQLYLDGRGGAKDPKQAARWLRLAANKGQHEAQAMLGAMFFNGEAVPRQAARGLMWLMLARDSAGPDEDWISEQYNSALKRASDEEREMALTYLEAYMKNRRD
jgi:TPR repeat protein